MSMKVLPLLHSTAVLYPWKPYVSEFCLLGNIWQDFGCYNLGSCVTGSQWVEGRDLAKHPTVYMTTPTTKNYPAQNVCSVQLINPVLCQGNHLIREKLLYIFSTKSYSSCMFFFFSAMVMKIYSPQSKDTTFFYLQTHFS